MSKRIIIEALGWGVILWLVGYLLGVFLFFLVPPSLLGWVIMPIGITLTLWVLLKKINSNSIKHYLLLGVVWALIAVVCDYLLLVKIFNPVDGYYKLDVYIYYFTTLFLPAIVGWMKILKKQNFQL